MTRLKLWVLDMLGWLLQKILYKQAYWLHRINVAHWKIVMHASPEVAKKYGMQRDYIDVNKLEDDFEEIPY